MFWYKLTLVVYTTWVNKIKKKSNIPLEEQSTNAVICKTWEHVMLAYSKEYYVEFQTSLKGKEEWWKFCKQILLLINLN